MKKHNSRGKRAAMILLSLAVLLAYSVPPVFAADSGTLTLRGALPNEKVDIYKIADVDKEGNITSYTSDFADLASRLPGDLVEPASVDYGDGDVEYANLVESGSDWAAAAETISAYIESMQAHGNPISPYNTTTLTTSAEGRLDITSLENGRYLVLAHPVVEVLAKTDTSETRKISTHLPTMLNMTGDDRVILMNGKYRERTTETNSGTTTRTVLKTWKDEGYENLRPASIQVQLLQGTITDEGDETWELYDEPVVLNAENGWSYAWTNLSTDYEWEIDEVSVPTGYNSMTLQNGTSFLITNTYKPPKPDEPGYNTGKTVKRTVRKVWEDNGNTANRPASIQVQLYRVDDEGNEKTQGKAETLSDANNWEFTWEKLSKNFTWIVKEVSNPSGYTVSTDDSLEVGSDHQLTLITNTSTEKVEKGDYTVEKKWVDDGHEANRPKSIQVRLKRSLDGENFTYYGDTKTLTSENGWKPVTWRNLDKKYRYTVVEEVVPDNYTAFAPIVFEEGVIPLTNTYVPPKTRDITVTKVWDDAGNTDKRPEGLQVQLRNGVENVGEEVTLNEENQWTYTWSELESGDDYNYNVVEVSVPKGYQFVASESGWDTTDPNLYVLKNKYEPDAPKKELKIHKNWDIPAGISGGEVDLPESITVILSHGNKNEEIDLKPEENWTYTETGLDETNYTIEEVKVNGKKKDYHFVLDPSSKKPDEKNNVLTFELTNVYQPVTYEVRKSWDDKGYESQRPESIQVQLYNGAETVGDPVTLSEDNNWYYKWDNLNADGTYEAVELDVPSIYTVKPAEDGSVHLIINSYVPPTPDKPSSGGSKTVNRTVEKVWKDSGYESKRPDSILVQLLKDGKPDGSPVELNAKNNWKFTWTKLSKKNEWTIQEVKVPDGYTATKSESGTTITLTNTYTPPTTPPDNPDKPVTPPEDNKTISYTAQKVWDDKGYEKKRPDSVEVQLLQNGQEYAKATLNDANEWKYTWEGLDPQYTWSVTEKSVPAGYDMKTNVEGSVVTVTNTYNPGKTTTPSTPTKTTGNTKLPQTGMLWWPVPVLAAAGLLLILLGLVKKNRRRSSDVE